MAKETQPAATGPALEFFFRLSRAYSTLTRRFDSSLGSFHGLSFADFMLLASLGRAPGARLRRVDLAERLGLTASGVTRALIPLEKIGLVKRQPDPRDARIGYAVLTPTGAKLLANAAESAGTVSEAAVQGVSPRQLEAFSALLAQLAGMTAANS